jgi:nitrate reductase cytochrome c-type subunit
MGTKECMHITLVLRSNLAMTHTGRNDDCHSTYDYRHKKAGKLSKNHFEAGDGLIVVSFSREQQVL